MSSDALPADGLRVWKFPEWVEPVVIVSVLLVAMWFSRLRNYSVLRPSRFAYAPLAASSLPKSPRGSCDSGPLSPSLDPTATGHPPKTRRVFCGLVTLRTPNSSRFARHPHSRLLQKFPFLVEMFYWAITLAFYRLTTRAGQWLYGGNDQVWESAQGHAMSILDFEMAVLPLGPRDTVGQARWLEWRVQQWFLEGARAGDWRGLFLTVLNRCYALLHIPGTAGFIAYYYAVAANHPRFCAVRRTMSLTNFMAFFIFIMYPVMPPRFLPGEYRFIDTVNAEDAESVWMGGQYVNLLAAMPSMHFGYAFCIGATLVQDSGVIPLVVRCAARLVRRRRRPDYEPVPLDDGGRDEKRDAAPIGWGSFLFGVWYPCWVLLTILATGNHYLMDALVAGGVVVVAALCNRVWLSLLPLEDLLLWVLRLEKPVPTTGMRQ